MCFRQVIPDVRFRKRHARANPPASDGFPNRQPCSGQALLRKRKPPYLTVGNMITHFPEKRKRLQHSAFIFCVFFKPSPELRKVITTVGAFILSMPERPEVGPLTEYYAGAMMTKPMKWFCRKSGKSKFTEKDIAGMKATAKLKAADRNPYSWNMDYYEYPDGSGYEGRFTRCGICVLMKKLGLYDLTPALCHLDYTMSQAGDVTDFVREYTLASGGPYCDCGYKRKNK